MIDAIDAGTGTGTGTNRPTNNNARAAMVREVLNQVATHFQQEIHARVWDEANDHDRDGSRDGSSSGGLIQVVSDVDDGDSDSDSEEQQQQRPAKQQPQPQQKQKHLPSIVRFWLDRLLSLASLPMPGTPAGSDGGHSEIQCQNKTTTLSSDSNGNSSSESYSEEGMIGVLVEWIRGYERVVRPLLFRSATVGSAAASGSEFVPSFHTDGLSVLTNYELILSEMLSQWRAAAAHDRSERSGSSAIPAPSSSNCSFDPRNQNGVLQRTILILSTDVTLLTVSAGGGNHEQSTTNNKTNRLRRSTTLPTIWKVLGAVLDTLRLVVLAAARQTTVVGGGHRTATNETTTTSTSSGLLLHDCYGSLRRCSVTLLAFEAPGTIVEHDDDDNDNDNDNDSDNGDGDGDGDETPVRSVSAVLSPHHLAPSLASSSSSTEHSHNTDLQILRRLLQQLEDDCFQNSGKGDRSSEWLIGARRYIDCAIGIDPCAYNDVDGDYWNSLPSTTKNSFSTEEWFDPRSKDAKRTSFVVRRTWRKMKDLLTVMFNHDGARGCEGRDKTNDENHVAAPIAWKEHRHHVNFVLTTLGGAGPLLRDARAHFFGRDMHGMEALLEQLNDRNPIGDDDFVAPSVVVRMGRRVVETKAKPKPKRHGDDAPHERIPSRLAAAMNAFRWLLVPGRIGEEDDSHRKNMLEDVFPICATLVDATSSVFVALGAAGFLRAADALQPQRTDIHSSGVTTGSQVAHYRTNNNNVEYENAWENFADNALSVLDRAFRSSSDPSAMLAIGGAQTKLLGLMVQRETEKNRESRVQRTVRDKHDRFRRRRRTVTGQWLSNLDRSLYLSTTKRKSLELLLGGVIPLLSQHAMEDDEESGADGMEVGRLGLAALLPLTTNSTATAGNTEQSDISRKTQMASMIALINLMFAAHPVMPSHGGKIMTHLLAAAVSSTTEMKRETSEYENENESAAGNRQTIASIRNIAILAAALALVICGPKFAGEILECVEKEGDNYQEELVSVVSEVRELAEGLKAQS